MLGRDPARAIELDLEAGFPRFMDEYRAEAGEPFVPFTHLVTVAQTVGDDVDTAAEMLRRGGYGEVAEDKEKLARDLSYARNWADGVGAGVDAARAARRGRVEGGGGGARRRAARLPA